MRHDVVQFAGDPQPLGQRGLGGGLGLLRLGPGVGQPDRVSDEPGEDRGKWEGDRDEVQGRPPISSECAPGNGTSGTGSPADAGDHGNAVTETLRVRVAAM